jgi:polar amino acid transport system permease protein
LYLAEFGPLSWGDASFVVSGAVNTVLLFLASGAVGLWFGSLIGLFLAGRPNRWTWAPRLIVHGYSATVRGIPVLVVILFVYYGPGFFQVQLDPFVASTIVLGGYASAALGEVIRASIDSISDQQWAAARSLGMTYLQTMRHVIGPQAARLAIPPAVGVAAQVLKGTALASTIGVIELTGVGAILSARTFEALLVFALIGACYFVLGLPLVLIGARAEKGLSFAF